MPQHLVQWTVLILSKDQCLPRSGDPLTGPSQLHAVNLPRSYHLQGTWETPPPLGNARRSNRRKSFRKNFIGGTATIINRCVPLNIFQDRSVIKILALSQVRICRPDPPPSEVVRFLTTGQIFFLCWYE